MQTLVELHHFFFQAEDGIRDGHVTGVQTCALPIWGSRRGSTCRAAASSTCASSPSRTGRRNRSASTWTCSAARQLEVAQRLRELGASDLDIGQGEVPWIVLGDVEGNPFCVMEHREVYEDRSAERRVG